MATRISFAKCLDKSVHYYFKNSELYSDEACTKWVMTCEDDSSLPELRKAGYSITQVYHQAPVPIVP